jgi:phage shock protein PspC (stress-responsive transcriptional regulator)
MTTEPSDTALPLDRVASARRLRRRTSDRVIGGVAGGIGDYLNVDPVLIRAAFAGLMIFGGAGLVLYVLGWLLIPEDGHEHSIVEAALRQVVGRAGRLGVVFLAFATIAILSPWVTGYGGVIYVQAEVFWALAIVLVGVILLLPQGRTRVGEARASAFTAAPAPPAIQEAAIASYWIPAVAAPPRERSPLGWYALAGVLVGLGLLAVAGNLAPVRVVPGQFFGAGLLALGVGLIVGAWWGRARLLILLGLVVLPAAAVSAFLTVPLEGGVADDAFRPENVAEVQPAYRLLGGRLRLDLSALDAGSEIVTVEASVGVGNLYVMVPGDATVEVNGAVQGGELVLLGREHVGTGLADRVADAGEGGGATLVLDLDVGIGSIWVERIPLEGHQ